MERLQYEFVNGKKVNSQLIYLKIDKQLFKLRSKTPNKMYYSCYYNKCSAGVELLLEDNSVIKPKKSYLHNHPDQETLYKELKAIGELKKDCIENASAIGQTNAMSCIRSAFNRVSSK